METKLKLDTFTVEGIHFISALTCESVVREALEFQPKKGDILLSAYPKCGNHWVKYIIWAIINDESTGIPGQVDMDTKLFPFLEYVGTNVIERMKPPRTMNLHLPYKFTPKSGDAKYVTIIRNIFDVAVSSFQFFYEVFQIDFESHFRQFLEGKTPAGCFIETTQSWYERRHDPNVLFLVYEDILEDHAGAVLQIASFMGDEYRVKLEKNPQTLSSIVRRTSFEYMKKNAPFRPLNVDSGKIFEDIAKNGYVAFGEAFDNKGQIIFYRNGKVGNGGNILNAEHRRILENLVNEKIKYPELAKLLLRK